MEKNGERITRNPSGAGVGGRCRRRLDHGGLHTAVQSHVDTAPPFATAYQWGAGNIGWDYPIQWDHEWLIPVRS